MLRKSELMDMQAAQPPFGGFVDSSAMNGTRVFMSPGPIWEPQGLGVDPWLAARGLFAAGIRPGDIVHNALSYHMTPGGFLLKKACVRWDALCFRPVSATPKCRSMPPPH